MRVSIIIFIVAIFVSISLLINVIGDPSGTDCLADFEFVGEIDISGENTYADGDAQEGDVLALIVKIENTGGSPAENVNVTLGVDGEIKRTYPIRTIKNGSDDVKTVIFSWVAVSGEHVIEINIDPDNSVNESNDQFTGENNNVISRHIYVSSMDPIKKRIDSPSPFAICGLIAFGSLLLLKGKKYKANKIARTTQYP